MPKSIFRSFFGLFAAIIVSAILVIGAVLLLVSKEYFKSSTKADMITAANEAIEEIKLSCPSGGQLDLDFTEKLLLKLADISNDEFTLTDSGGDLLICTEQEGSCTHKNRPFSQRTLQQVSQSGAEGYFLYGTLDSIDEPPAFNLGSKFMLNNETFYLFSQVSPNELEAYLRSLLLTFGAVAVVIVATLFPIVYFSVKRLTDPIKDMTIAAKRFGEGDFSQKVDIKEENELGYLANTLNEMAASLEIIEETRKSFVSNVSHELKTPMTSIGGFIDGILDGTIPEDKHRYYLGIVSDEVKRLARLVRSMLNIAKYETGDIAMKTEDFDIVPLVIKTVLLFEKRIEDKNVEVIGLDTGRFFVNADTDLIQQVIYNLVENAIKFVNDGGYIKFTFSQENDKTLIGIRNSGEGLNSEELPQVFDRFYKTDASRGKDKTGVGLGLSIVRSIVKLHDGTISVKSALNEYVEFIFSLNTGKTPDKKGK